MSTSSLFAQLNQSINANPLNKEYNFGVEGQPASAMDTVNPMLRNAVQSGVSAFGGNMAPVQTSQEKAAIAKQKALESIAARAASAGMEDLSKDVINGVITPEDAAKSIAESEKNAILDRNSWLSTKAVLKNAGVKNPDDYRHASTEQIKSLLAGKNAKLDTLYDSKGNPHVVRVNDKGQVVRNGKFYNPSDLGLISQNKPDAAASKGVNKWDTKVVDGQLVATRTKDDGTLEYKKIGDKSGATSGGWKPVSGDQVNHQGETVQLFQRVNPETGEPEIKTVEVPEVFTQGRTDTDVDESIHKTDFAATVNRLDMAIDNWETGNLLTNAQVALDLGLTQEAYLIKQGLTNATNFKARIESGATIKDSEWARYRTIMGTTAAGALLHPDLAKQSLVVTRDLTRIAQKDYDGFYDNNKEQKQKDIDAAFARLPKVGSAGNNPVLSETNGNAMGYEDGQDLGNGIVYKKKGS